MIYARMVCAAFIAVPVTVLAVPYTPPAGVGWWQLQTTDGQYTEACNASGPPCNVPAGTYTLIDFGTRPATRQRVSVGADQRLPFSGVTVTASTECRVLGNLVTCDAVCPVETFAIGTQCDTDSATPALVTAHAGRCAWQSSGVSVSAFTAYITCVTP